MNRVDARRLAELHRVAFPRPDQVTDTALEIVVAAFEELEDVELAQAAMERMIREERWRPSIATIREVYRALENRAKPAPPRPVVIPAPPPAEWFALGQKLNADPKLWQGRTSPTPATTDQPQREEDVA